MHVTHLGLVDFRSYATAELSLSPGAAAFIGRNGQGKTNLVEAIEYAATQASHRVATDAPLVRFGAEQAVVRAAVRRADRQALVELEINPGRANRARLNRSPVPRARDVLGIVRTVVFSPDDLELVKGDPSARRRYLDDLLVARQPRYAAVRADYDRVLRQRNTLLKTAGGRGGRPRNDSALETLQVWNGSLAHTGAELLSARIQLTAALRPYAARHYADLASSVPRTGGGNEADLDYRPSLELPPGTADVAQLREALLAELDRRRLDELDRGVSLVGPHRDDVHLRLGPLPAKGYASHGESWSFALALRLAAFELLREDGDDPVLILDDVFAELDELRRNRLAALVSGAEQVLVTAAVPADVPGDLREDRYDVVEGSVSHA